MDVRRKGMPKPVRVQNPAVRVLAARGLRVDRLARPVAAPRMSRRDFQRGMIVLASLAVLFGCVLAGGYGVHAQISAATERAALHNWQLAAATRDELRNGSLLFVPIGGNICRRRWIDNTTWTLRDGGEVECDREVSWNATVPELQSYQVGLRMDAVRSTFRNKATGNME
jgi:hypothetical protein